MMCFSGDLPVQSSENKKFGNGHVDRQLTVFAALKKCLGGELTDVRTE